MPGNVVEQKPGADIRNEYRSQSGGLQFPACAAAGPAEQAR
jgi:hypothetical protein